MQEDVAAPVTGLRKPGAVQAAARSLATARETREVAAADFAAAAADCRERGAETSLHYKSAGRALLAAQKAELAARADLAATLVAWAPAALAMLAPHRRAACDRLREAVGAIVAAYDQLWAIDCALTHAGLDPARPTWQRDVRALLESAKHFEENNF
jgi:hypothetical protein